MSDPGLKLHPVWRQAEADLLAAGLAHGSMLTKEQLLVAFGIGPAATIAQHERNELEFLRQFQSLRESLLQNHRMMLRPVRGSGYAVVPPAKQTSVAMSDRTREVRRAMQKLELEVGFVDTSALTIEQRKENSDAQAKIACLRSLMRKQLLPPQA